jgi:lysophospholipase L1-like esterase
VRAGVAGSGVTPVSNGRPKRTDRVARSLARVAVLVVVTVVCLEAAARLGGVRAGWLNPRLYAPNPVTVYANRPGFRGDFAGACVSINSMGLRGEEIPRRKPPGEFRILILGDSVAFGQGVAQGDVFPSRLQSLLQADAGPRTYRVINAGVPGFNTQNERDYLLHAGEQLQPDAIVVLYVDNDADPQLFVGFSDDGVPLTADGPFTRQDWIGHVSAFLYRHSSLYTFIRRTLLMARAGRSDDNAYNRQAGDRFSDVNPGFAASKDALADMQRWSLAHRVPFVVAVFSRLPLEAADAYRDAVVTSCQHAQIPVVVVPLISAGERLQGLIIPWDGHPNARAHARIAERVRDALSALGTTPARSAP